MWMAGASLRSIGDLGTRIKEIIVRNYVIAYEDVQILGAYEPDGSQVVWCRTMKPVQRRKLLPEAETPAIEDGSYVNI
jgi:hypothetical protein